VELKTVEYKQLNARQKENFNFQKVSAVLADYGFVTLRLSDDWNGADFIALHISGEDIRAQLKGRLTFEQKYRGRGLYVAFGENGAWYLYPHDELFDKVLAKTNIGNSESLREHGAYSYPHVPETLQALLEPYRITGSADPAVASGED
jgi:hypothetical protein